MCKMLMAIEHGQIERRGLGYVCITLMYNVHESFLLVLVVFLDFLNLAYLFPLVFLVFLLQFNWFEFLKIDFLCFAH